MTTQMDLAECVRTAAANSSFLKSMRTVALDESALRHLHHGEIAQLLSAGNSAEDWLRIRVVEHFDPRRVIGCTFFGDVHLGHFAGVVPVADGITLPAGLVNATIGNCVINDGALVRNVALLAGCVVGRGAAILNCGSVTGGPTTFANGLSLPIGIETGGREVAIFAELDVALAAEVAIARKDRARLKAYESAVREYTEQARCTLTIIGAGASLRHTPRIDRVYVGPHAVIDGATLVSECTLLSSADEPVRIESGAIVTCSILQWGVHVETLAIVSECVLTEHSHADRHAKVTRSIIGPNTGVGEGEVTASLLGPFVGFHHQSLLIAAVWPEGKGNVAAGANVGSNHTSRAADQEIFPGEGTFFGLGVDIKFPSDFREAPYSIIASGVKTLPQKISFPFSLINTPRFQGSGLSPAYNELIPAWVLTDSLYTLRRNEGKYIARNQARRTPFDFAVFRPDTVDRMLDACRRLEVVREVKEFYTEHEIAGLGKNYLLERFRVPAIKAYRFHARAYALLGLKRTLEMLREQLHELPTLLVMASDDAAWEHQRRLLLNLGCTDLVLALRELPAILEKIAADVEESKARDDMRGAYIIDDYGDAHPVAAVDPFVKKCWEQTRRLQEETYELLDRIRPLPLAA